MLKPPDSLGGERIAPQEERKIKDKPHNCRNPRKCRDVFMKKRGIVDWRKKQKV